MKRTYLFAAAAALILAGCGSLTERPADSNESSKNVKFSDTAVSSTAEVSSEETEESPAEAQEESSSADDSSAVTDSIAETSDESKNDGMAGQFTGGLDDDGKGPDENHFGTEVGFAPGIWWSFCNSGDIYYEFSTDGTGMRVYQADGFKEGFTYEMKDGYAVFYFAGNAGGTDEYTRAKAEDRGDGALLTFENDSHTEELVYRGNISFDDFSFYTNKELEDMAREYYKQHSDSGYEPEFCDVSQSDSNTDIVIHLYDIFDDHSATVAWYYVDRFTGKGKDLMDKEVDLSTALKG